MSSISTRPAAADARGPRPAGAWASWLVLAICAFATLVGTAYVSYTARSGDQVRFTGVVHDIQLALLNRLETYLALLRAGAALFAASDEVSRSEFHEFVAHLELRDRFPGIQGIGFSVRVPRADVEPFERRMREQGPGEFKVWPADPPRDEYYPIAYLEPLDRRNAAALGYDMFSQPTRREAMERAALSGRATASGRVILVQEIEAYKQAGFLIYQPVYREGRTPDGIETRRASLVGYVYSPFRAEDLLNTLLEPEDRELLAVQVYDGDRPDAGALLFDSTRPGMAPETAPPFRAERRIEVAGRPWTLVVQARPAFASSSPLLALEIFLAGVFLSLLLFQLTRLEARARAQAEATTADLQRSEEALQAANRAKDEFLATLSHELRTPLNAILGWARMLRMGHLDEPRQARALEVIERNARVQTQLIEDLLDVSRIITGKLRLDVRSMRVNPVLEEALHSVRPAAEAKGITMTWQPDPDAGVIFAAPDRIQQIAWNLLSNAIKFTPAGGRVDVATRREGETVTLVVRDTGIGIAPEFLPHVFERFRQADSTTTRSHAGVGLGLAIVRHLVELHGGTISARSEGENRGATFTVRFPTRPGADAPPAAEAPAAAVSRAETDRDDG